MKLFFDKHLPVEDRIDEKIKQFIELIKSDRILKKYVKIFGLTGPAARGQASSRGSDIDFYCITNYINPFHENYLQNRFNSIFKYKNLDVGVLIFAPSVLKRPDLMFFEFSNSGKIFYGKLNFKPKITQIPKWEGIRSLAFKGNPFLCSFDKKRETFHYSYSKLILGIGEAFLLLDNKYVADDFKRNELVKHNHYAKSIPGFLKEYELAYGFRYKNSMFNESDANLKQKGLTFLREAWKIYLEEYFNANYEDSLKKLQKIKPDTIIRRLTTRTFYTINYLRIFRKLRITFREPFIKEILMIQKYLTNPDKHGNLRRLICESQSASPRFWYAK